MIRCPFHPMRCRAKASVLSLAAAVSLGAWGAQLIRSTPRRLRWLGMSGGHWTRSSAQRSDAVETPIPMLLN